MLAQQLISAINATFASCDWIRVSTTRKKSNIPQLGCAVLNHLSLAVIHIKDFFLPLNERFINDAY